MRALRLLALLVTGMAALALLLFAFLQTPPGKRLLAGLVSDKTLQVSGLGGFFPTDLEVARIELLDEQGTWLRIEKARLRWSFASLFEGRVRIETLSAGLVDVLRPPLADKTEPAPSGGRFDLPIGIDLLSLSIDTLHLAAPVAEVDSRWTLQGRGLLSADLHEGRVRLSADRTDGPSGRLSADARFDLVRRTVDGEVLVEEGQGGVAAALLQRPDLPQVSMRLQAKGDAASGSGELSLSAGDAATAQGTARWQPQGAATAVSVRLEAAGTQLANRGGPVSLSAEATVDQATATLSRATLAAGTLRLAASGSYDRKVDRLDGTVRLQSDEPGPFADLLAGARWRNLDLTAHAVLQSLAGQPQGTIALTGSADDVAAPDNRLPALGKVALDAGIGVHSDGSFTLDSLDLKSALASVSGGVGSYKPKTEAAEAKATVELPSLAPFSALAGRDLAGRARVELTARSDADGLRLGWQGVLTDAGAPDVPPGLIASSIALSGAATLQRDDTWSLSDIRVATDAASFGLSGRGQGSTGRFDLSLDLRQLSALRAGLAGGATVASTIELRPDGTAGGSLTANGDVAGQPLSLAGRFDRDASGGIVVPSFEGHWASAVLNIADLAITPDRTTGSARLKVARLEEVGAQLGADLAGSLEAELDTDPELAAGRLKARIRGAGLQGGGVRMAALQVDATIDDPMGNAVTDASIAASGMSGAGDIGRVNATVKGDRPKGFDVALQAAGASTNAGLAAKVELLADEIRVALSRFDGRHRGIPVALNAPTRLRIVGEQVRIDPTTLRLGGGRLALQGVVDPVASDLRVDVAGLPLSLIDTFAPGTGLDGSLQSRARIAGPSAAPRIEATYTASNVRLRRPEAALLPPLSLQGSGSLAGRQASIDARLSAGSASSLVLKGKGTTAPLAGKADVTGTIDLAPFAPLIGNQVRGVAGTLRSNLTFDVAGARITGAGSLDLSNGALNFPEVGLRLSGGTARIRLQGDALHLQRLSFHTGRNGTLTASGTMRLDPAQGVVLDLAVASRRALLVNRADLVATVSSDLKLTGSTGGAIDLAGPVTVDRAEIAVGAGQAASYPTVEVRETNRPGASDAPPAATPASRPSAITMRLSLDVRAPQAVFVRGRGLDAEMGGALQVAGDPASPVVTGGLRLRRGDFTLGGRRLVFRRGIVTLDNLNRIDPRLDFLAAADIQSSTVQIAITGTARAPVIAVTAVPAMPSDEALALLLFGKPASSLSAFELIQVAQTLAELTGKDAPATGMLGRLRQGLGLDQLRLGSSGASGSSPVSVEAGRYVAPGVYVGAKQGAGGNSSRGVVEIDVWDNTKIEGDIGADSRGRVGVKMEWDY
jgi:translocation and assembly module TamB